MLILITCVDNKLGIGKDNKLPWRIKEELQHFKDTTLNHIVVMGRKTFESIGKPLPNRTNIVLSRSSIHINDVISASSIDSILNLAKTKDVYIAGGAEIYKLFNNYYDKLIISSLDKDYNCDTFLDIDLINYKLNKIIDKKLFTVAEYERK